MIIMFRKSIPTRLFTTNSILFGYTKLQPIAINRTFTQYVNKNKFSNSLISQQIPLIDNKKYFSNKIKIQEIIVNDKKYLSTQNNKHDNKNVDYYMGKYNRYSDKYKLTDYLLIGLLGLFGLFVSTLTMAFIICILAKMGDMCFRIIYFCFPFLRSY